MKKWNGCWVIKIDSNVCRWMLVWQESENGFLGCLAGYSGGGAFQLEKFIISDNDYLVDGDDSWPDNLTSEIISILEGCQDRITDFHDSEKWLDDDNLILKPQMIKKLSKLDDLLLGGADIPPKLLPLFDKLGLISSPIK